VEKVRVGIVGMGQRSCHHGGALFKDCPDEALIAGVCDNRPERLALGKKMYAEVFGYPVQGYLDYIEMYEKADLDAVFIAGPNCLHRDMSISALERGLHVLCEKPMETTLAKCDEMIAAAERAKRILAMGMQMFYTERPHKILELIKQGVIGKVAMVWCTEYREPFAEMKDWVWDQGKSGGAIVEKNCHHYGILDMWAQSDPTTVYATGNILKHFVKSGKESQIVDNAWVVNDFENGARGMVGVCFLGGQHNHYRELGVIGTEGRIFYSRPTDNQVIHVRLNNGMEMDINTNAMPLPRGGVFRDFLQCVRTGAQPLVTGELARRAILIPLAAEKSIAEKRVVQVSELE